MALRSDVNRSLQGFEKLKDNVLPLNIEIVGHYYYLKKTVQDWNVKFMKKSPGFRDVKDNLMRDVVALWDKGCVPIISSQRIEAKLKDLIRRYEAARKNEIHRGKKIDEEWKNKLFDICRCKCIIAEEPVINRKKLQCNCAYENRIPEKEVLFIKDQREGRKMYISNIDTRHERSKVEKATHRRKSDAEQPCSSGMNATSSESINDNAQVMVAKLRKRDATSKVYRLNLSEEEEETLEDSDEDYEAKGTPVGGKRYEKVRIYSVSDKSCILADRRMTSIRQQSDQLLSVVDRRKISASASSVYRRREEVRMKALILSDTALATTSALQLCYDGRVIDKIDRYVFLGQFVSDKLERCESVMLVKSFPKPISVTAEVIFDTITEEISSKCLQNVYSIMADTTALNTGKKSGVNTRLEGYFNNTVGHDIHSLECLFHVNEIYLTHVISMVKGKKKGPDMMEGGALLNNISAIHKPTIENLVPREQLNIPVTNIAAIHLKAKLEWFSNQKRDGTTDHSFRTDQLCMLVLASYAITDIPDNLKNLLLYKQERICHSRWVTTSNGYLRSLLFNVGNLLSNEKTKLQKIVSYIINVYVPSFLMIHLNPGAPEGPFLTLFQRDLLVAFRDIDPAIVEMTMKYYLEHASQWLSWKNVALSVHAEVAPYSVEAVKACSLPQTVDVRSMLEDRTTRLKQFFTMRSKEAPCIAASHVQPTFWKSIDNNNRVTERRIGKLKSLVNSKISEDPNQLNRSDIRLRAFLCNMDN